MNALYQKVTHSVSWLAMAVVLCLTPPYCSAAPTKSKGVKAVKSKSSEAKSTTGSKTATAKADTYVDHLAFDSALMSKLVFDLTNVERRQAGLNSFSMNPRLVQSSTAHSQDMASRVYFAHKSQGFLHRTNPRDRVQAVGYNPGMVAENIAMIPTFSGQKFVTYPGTGYQKVETFHSTYRQVAETSMREWMKSPGHRENILNPRLKTLGVGVAVGLKDNVPYVYLTQNFGG